MDRNDPTLSLRPSKEALDIVPPHLSKKHRVLPLSVLNDCLYVAVAEDSSAEYLRFLEQVWRGHLSQTVVSSHFLTTAIEHYYAHRRPSPTANDFHPPHSPVAVFAENVLSEAISKGCSDVHIEPSPIGPTIRFRKDGFLRVMYRLDTYWQLPLTAYLKLKAQLNIADKYRPQEGHFVSGESNVRLSCIPSAHGETIVMRLLSPATRIPDLRSLGWEHSENFLRRVGRLKGCVVLSGLIGSGKTTTLYSLILYLSRLNKRILTVEDPVEHQLPNVNQIQVASSASGESLLRSILRQNVDVLVIGELRSYDRLIIALHAALAGHLVLTTVHARNAHQVVDRLLDMGASPQLLGATLRYVVHQSLVRKVCPACAEDVVPAPEERAFFPAMDGVNTWKRARGCPQCLFTGYDGRVGVFEAFVYDDLSKMKDLKTRLHRDGPRWDSLLSGLLQNSVVDWKEARRLAELR
jgi:type IV pilus assembly protein PilB